MPYHDMNAVDFEKHAMDMILSEFDNLHSYHSFSHPEVIAELVVLADGGLAAKLAANQLPKTTPVKDY